MRAAEPHARSDDVCLWPLERADEAIEALAYRSGLGRERRVDADDGAPPGDPPEEGTLRDVPPGTSDGERPDPRAAALGPWIEEVAEQLGLEVEETEVPHSDVESLVRGCGPALLRVSPAEGLSGDPWLLAVLGSRGGAVRLLGSDLAVHKRTVKEVGAWLCREVEVAVLPKVERLLEKLQVSPRRAARARSALLTERLRQSRLRGFWLLRRPPGASFWRQMADDGLHRELAKYVAMYALSYGLMLVSWWTLGRGALDGHLSRDWLLAWALLLLTMILPRLLSYWSQARLAVGVATLLKRRLLQGALKLDPDEIRHQGAGQLLGRVIESETLQTYALTGGFQATVGGIELVMSAWVLSYGAAGWPHVALLALWLVGVLLVGWRYLTLRRDWTDERLEMTHGLVESMIGHRTRLVQEQRGRWHAAEDQRLEGYLTSSRLMDQQRTWLIVSSFAWVLPGIVAVLPAFIAGRSSVASMALAVGGVLLAFRAFNKLSRGFTYLSGAWISWQQAAPIFHAAARGSGAPALGRSIALQGGADTPLLEARELVYRYRERARPVLDGCSLEIRSGDRILLEGPSGGGKSTLAALITRLRRPSSGLLLLGGLDRHTVTPDVWRRHVVSAPQFHENHVFTETFAFNLLMGRRWPPRPSDMAEAEELCRELGLGELLERMPAGLLQLVGETGWQLSHGERSRLFMARALLQGTDLVILDESFAALDPENLHRALHCALDRAPTLLVIAHP